MEKDISILTMKQKVIERYGEEPEDLEAMMFLANLIMFEPAKISSHTEKLAKGLEPMTPENIKSAKEYLCSMYEDLMSKK